MLTRVFLLLLAMMGLSAAQAAEGSRASHGAAVAAALASVAQEASEAVAVAKPRAHIAFLAPDFRRSNEPAKPSGRSAPDVAATRLSDRQRT
jgi:hypothetical protein